VTQTEENVKIFKTSCGHLGGHISSETSYDNQDNCRRTTCTMPHTVQTLYWPVSLKLN